MNKVFNEGEPVYSPKFGKGFVLGVDVAKATGRYHVLVRFEGLGDVPYFVTVAATDAHARARRTLRLKQNGER